MNGSICFSCTACKTSSSVKMAVVAVACVVLFCVCWCSTSIFLNCSSNRGFSTAPSNLRPYDLAIFSTEVINVRSMLLMMMIEISGYCLAICRINSMPSISGMSRSLSTMSISRPCSLPSISSACLPLLACHTFSIPRELSMCTIALR